MLLLSALSAWVVEAGVIWIKHEQAGIHRLLLHPMPVEARAVRRLRRVLEAQSLRERVRLVAREVTQQQTEVAAAAQRVTQVLVVLAAAREMALLEAGAAVAEAHMTVKYRPVTNGALAVAE